METMTTERYSIGPWRFTWHGGRLADVAHITAPDRALDTIDTGGYDWEKGTSTATPDDFRQACHEWVATRGADVEANEVPYL